MKIIEEPQLEVKSKLPWFIDAFLYPTSIAGLIHVTFFVLLPRLWFFLIKLSLSCIPRIYRTAAGEISGPLTVIFYVLFIGYFSYYIYDCILDSTKGCTRAPASSFGAEPYSADIWELLSKVFLVVGSIAVCFCPTAIYYIFTQRTDTVFWLLFAIGAFFLPMSFLAVTMFDSFHALSPILIMHAILRTFFAYFGLLLFFYSLCLLVVILLPRLPLWGFLIAGLRIYFIFVAAYLLGRFYWPNKNKLNWGI